MIGLTETIFLISNLQMKYLRFPPVALVLTMALLRYPRRSGPCALRTGCVMVLIIQSRSYHTPGSIAAKTYSVEKVSDVNVFVGHRYKNMLVGPRPKK